MLRGNSVSEDSEPAAKRSDKMLLIAVIAFIAFIIVAVFIILADIGGWHPPIRMQPQLNLLTVYLL